MGMEREPLHFSGLFYIKTSAAAGYRETAPIPYLEFCTDKESTLFFSEEDKQIRLFSAGVIEVTFACAGT